MQVLAAYSNLPMAVPYPRTVLTIIFENDHYGVAELSYEIDSLNLLTGSVEFSHTLNSQNNGQFTNALNADGSVGQQYQLQTTGLANGDGVGASMNYQLGFKKKKDQLLTLSYRFEYTPNTQNLDNIFSNRLQPLPVGATRFYAV